MLVVARNGCEAEAGIRMRSNGGRKLLRPKLLVDADGHKSLVNCGGLKEERGHFDE